MSDWNVRVICRTEDRNDIEDWIGLHMAEACPPHWTTDLAAMVETCIDELLPDHHFWDPKTGLITGPANSTWTPDAQEIRKLLQAAFTHFLEWLPRECHRCP